MRRVAVTAGAALLLTTATISAGIVNELPTVRVNGKIMYYYDTQSGDNIYTVAEKLGVSVDDIRSYNPSVSDGIKPRMRLFFPTGMQTTEKGDSKGPLTHVVAKGESIYGIARQYGLTMDELLALNPHAAEGIKSGMRLNLPGNTKVNTSPLTEHRQENTSHSSGLSSMASTVKTSEKSYDKETASERGYTVPNPEEAQSHMEETDNCTADSIGRTYTENTDTVAPDTEITRELNVAIILPFLLEEENMGRQTQLYTEFYKGFLLAADTLNRQGRIPVRLHTYDSYASLDSVRAIMNRPEMAHTDLIVAPDNIDQLHAIARTAPQNALILNTFAVKDTAYLSTPGMIQTNIPHDRMYARAIDGFLDRFPAATPVFISRKGGRNDKEEFTTELKHRLSQEGRIYQTVNFDGYLADADLEMFDPDTSSYVFIPSSGNRDEFMRILHALKAIKGRAVDASAVKVFGYPEWATFRGSQFDDICDLETTIYSRYFPIERDMDARQLNEAFRRTYGEGVLDKQMPVLGILGYDTGLMVIDGLRKMAAEDEEFPAGFSGIQSGIRLERAAEDGGLVNDALFLIDYTPGGGIEKTLR